MRRWRRVSANEVNRVLVSLHRRGILYNGMTHAELVRLYGTGNLKHRKGYGWYKLTKAP